MRGGTVSLGVLAAALVLSASAGAASQVQICQAIATAAHLKAATTCPKATGPSETDSFTVSVKAPAGFKATVAYSILDDSSDAQVAWQYDASDGPETTLPYVSKVPGVKGASSLYLAPGQDDAEAAALVGTVIVDVILVPSTGQGSQSTLKSEIAPLLASAATLVRGAETKAG